MTFNTLGVSALFGGSKPVGLQTIASPILTRRELLGGALAAPAFFYVSTAISAEHGWYDLDFILSADLKSLTVRERYVGVPQGVQAGAAASETIPKSGSEDISWVIQLAAFGPSAYFDMAEPPAAPIDAGHAPARTIYIRNMEYGLRYPSDGGAQTKGLLGFRFTRPGRRWTIEYFTDLWLKNDGSTEIVDSEIALFSAFVAATTPDARGAEATGRTLPFQDISYSRVARTLGAMFADEVRLGSGAGNFRVILDRNLVWTLVGQNKRRVSLLGGRVEASVFSFAWQQANKEERPVDAASKEAETQAKATRTAGASGSTPVFVYFSGFAGPDSLTLSSADRTLSLGGEHRVVVRPADFCAMRLDVVVGRASFKPSENQVVSALSFTDGGIAVRDDEAVLADGVGGREIVITQTTLPGGSKVRRAAVWGFATGVGPSLFTKDAARSAWHEPGDVQTPVGRLRVGRPEFEVPKPDEDADARPPAPVNDGSSSPGPGGTSAASDGTVITVTKGELAACAPLPPESHQMAQLGRIFRAANGDRGGVPDATIFVIYDQPKGLRRIQIDLSLYATNAALPDTSFSRLTFRGSILRLTYEDGAPITELELGEYPRPIASSSVWIGPLVEGGRRASFDLTGATLTCARDYDLMKLKLRFHDLVLDFGPQVEIRPAREDGRVWVGDDGTLHDTRPVLVAEFDPQHVMEEAIFRPEAPELPDVDLAKADVPDDYKSRDKILAKLAEQPDAQARAKIRKEVRAAKTENDIPSKPFGMLADAFAAAAPQQPVDQRDYIGPFALDADRMALARTLVKTRVKTAVEQAINDMLGRVEQLAAPGSELRAGGRLIQVPDSAIPSQQTAIGQPQTPMPPPETNFQNALRNEAVFESLEPMYGMFRSFWRDRLVEYLSFKRRGATDNQIKQQFGFLVPAGADPITNGFRAEYLSINNRFDEYRDPVEGDAPIGVLRALLVTRFVDFALGVPDIPDLVGARLSGKSRLAFRIDCEPPVGADAYEAGTAASSGADPTIGGAGNTAYKPIPFTFEALTDWSRYEASVTRRAAKLFTALPSGMLPRPGSRATNPGDHEMMRFQGFTESPQTSEGRMAEVRATLMSARTADPSSGEKPYPGEPLDFETAIELPARLILSTAQDAIWRTNRRMPTTILTAKDGSPVAVGRSDERPPTLDEGEYLAAEQETTSAQPRDLWSVRLDIDEEIPPWLRAVSSPDLRINALSIKRGNELGLLPGRGAPPRGPYAPWFIGPDQAESGTLLPDDVHKALLGASPPAPGADPASVCANPKETAKFRLIRWLCERVGFREALPTDNYAFFRTSLDAFDRHQLVLLTSTYGLPVIGKRLQAGSTVDESGALLPDADQIEPGEAFALLDAKNDQAVHKPVSLKVKALSLSALGGSLLHETSFKPSAGADDIFGNKIFEGFSIDTLQQDIVLGRDVRTEVVYKGYLLPLGHKASFVKLTERVFLRTPQQGVKAMLRQRMYLRMADRDKLYGAVGQPHGGRLWCGKLVSLIADKTPDILDPTFPIDGGVNAKEHPESLNGRIDLGGGPGLAFWPRTDITEAGLYKFEITIDGTPTSLPMIFVDNIAATTAKSLKAAVDHYNGKFPNIAPEKAAEKDRLEKETSKRRTLTTSGLEIDYAPNSNAGEAQFKTQTIHIWAHGRSRSTFATGWLEELGAQENFETTGVLEGASQPPFYPAMEKAVIRIGSAERLSGGGPQPIEVQYDGHYVLYGFAGDPEPQGLDPPTVRNANPQEVFLNLRQAASLGMGGNGDRSGGIARPNAHIVAISRKFGPLGGDISTWWAKARNFPDPDLTPINPAKGKPGKPIPAGGQPSDEPDFSEITDSVGAGKLVSLAPYFNDQIKRPLVEQVPQGDENSVAFKVDTDSGQLTDAIKQVQSFFSLDAKLLGTVRLKDLMALLGLSANDIPVLKEVQEFGTSALREVNEAVGETANGVSNDVRSRVLAPLRDVISLLRSAWNKLDAELTEKQVALLNATPGATGKAAPFKLAAIYPEINSGLVDVERTLNEALATEDAVALIPRLAVIYSTSRQFIRALAIVAANPVERLEAGLTASLNEIGGILSKLKSLVDSLEQLPQTLLNDAASVTAERVTTWLFEKAGPDATPIAELLPLGSVPPDLKAVLAAIAPNTESDLSELWAALEGIEQTLRAEILDVTRGGVRAAINASLIELFASANAKAAAKAGVEAFKTITQDDEGYPGAVGKAKDAVIAANKRLFQAESELQLRAKKALDEALDFFIDGIFDAVIDEYPQALQALAARLQWADTSIDQARQVASAVKSGDPRKILETSAAFSQHVLGVNVAGVLTLYAEKVETPFVGAVSAAAQVFKNEWLKIENTDQLLAEADLCATFYTDKKPFDVKLINGVVVASSKMLQPIAEAINALAALEADLKKLDADFFDDAAIANAPGDVGTKAKDLHTSASNLIYKTPTDNLRHLTAEIFCDIVKVQIAVRDWTPPTGLTRTDIEKIGSLARLLTSLSQSIAKRLDRVVELASTFLAENGAIVAGGVIGAKLAKYLDEQGVIGQLQASNRNLLDGLKVTAEKAEARLVAAATELGNKGLRLLSNSTAGATDAIKALNSALGDIDRAVSGFGLSLEPEITMLASNLVEIEAIVAQYNGLNVPANVATIQTLLAAPLGNGKSFEGFFAAQDSSQFRQLVERLRRLEDGIQRELLVLQLRIKGAPDIFKSAVLGALGEWGVFAAAARGYVEIKKTRDKLLDNVAAIGLLAPVARKSLLVPTDAGLAKDGAPACAVDDLQQALETLKDCDRLSQELQVLQEATNLAQATVEAEKAVLRRRIVAFYTGWASGAAAPLKIIEEAREMAMNILRGDVLAAIDLGAFRDQIEDAIAALIPTKVHFSYDFASVVAKASGDQAIFQPKVGGAFGIEVRASADLLTQKTDFRATAHIGPFDIFLIGGVVDALWLKFGGAAFSIGQGTSGRFDVNYLDFMIGPDLKFAEKLQSFLSPKEGNGVFIQPMTRAAGVEAGYSLYLGTIGVGVTSFQNVSLAVSAELPFDETESLFKVSLGRRMAPFTMGVFPFVGCGYFAIFAAADGVRGFEAAFEYGGGAAIGYGPLQAQVRISAGVFIRILKVDGRRTTEIYGTFFAGGSASIWIFSFATSLYVRLGRASGGSMYGEAIYSFSFSLGFADYNYSVTVFKREKPLGGGQGQASLNLPQGGTRYAEFDGVDGVDPIITGQTSAVAKPAIRIKAKGQADWNTYASYFDKTLLKGILS